MLQWEEGEEFAAHNIRICRPLLMQLVQLRVSCLYSSYCPAFAHPETTVPIVPIMFVRQLFI
jgi:hypothetical protein